MDLFNLLSNIGFLFYKFSFLQLFSKKEALYFVKPSTYIYQVSFPAYSSIKMQRPKYSSFEIFISIEHIGDNMNFNKCQ